MKQYLTNLLAHFRFFRRYLGGTWYKVVDPLDAGGMQSPVVSWTTYPPDHVEILESEKWPVKQTRGVLILSIVLNILLAASLLFFFGKRLLFQKHLDATLKAHTYLDNPQYVEQFNLQGGYDKQANIAIFGNSHVYKAHWNELLKRDDVVARGIGSDVTEGYLHRINQVLKVHPKIVFIEGGANDLWYHCPTDTIILHLQELTEMLRGNNIQVVLTQLPPFASSEPTADQYNARVRDLNEQIVYLSRREGTACIDLYTLLSDRGYLRKDYAQPDGVHLTAAGYAVWAGEIQRVLTAIHPAARRPA